MSAKKCKSFAISVLAAATVISAPARAASTIKIAVAANFGTTVTALANAFINLPTSKAKGYGFTVDSKSSGDLLTAIQNGTATYDVFFSADLTRPNSLTTSSFTTVKIDANGNPIVGPVGSCVVGPSQHACGTGSPFLYAVGELEFWDPTQDVHVAGLAGAPFTFNAGFSPSIVIADPAKAPYGYNAEKVLLDNATWAATLNADKTISCKDPLTGVSSVFCFNAAAPAHGVFTQGNISLTYSAVKSGLYKAGFVAQSAICTANPNTGYTKTFANYHYTYAYNNATYPHDKIMQFAIPLSSNAAGTELNDFITYLQSTAGQTAIKSACYALN